MKIQKLAARSLANLDSRDSCRPALKQLRINTVTAIYIQELILHTDKLGLPKVTQPHCYNTRNASLISPFRHRTVLHDKKPLTRLYNELPASFKQLIGKAMKRELVTFTPIRGYWNILSTLFKNSPKRSASLYPKTRSTINYNHA
ncbi:hypothetical protein J6590_072857 [Homalodisca vitripennis]|nr:hypothetical protein J6590_072857 [Homalodisca vitripennis]